MGRYGTSCGGPFRKFYGLGNSIENRSSEIVLFSCLLATLSSDQHASAVTALVRTEFWGAGMMLPPRHVWDETSMYWNVLFTCSPEAGTQRRKPGQKMSVWPPRHVRGAILTLAAIVIFIYLQRNGPDAGSMASMYCGIVT
jgi:hypothetical protein